MIPSYFKIEILAIQDEIVLLGHKGLITGKLLVFHAFLIHYFHNSKNKGERPKRTSDSDSTSKNT